MENLILEDPKKSFLRKKWEEILKKIIIRKIPEKYLTNEEVIFLNNEKEIRDFFDQPSKNLICKKKIIVLLVPLNNFVNLLSFLEKIDKVLDEDVRVIINYFSHSWKFIFKLFSFLKLINNFNESLFFSKKTFNIFLNCTNYEISKKLNEVSLPFEIPYLTKIFSILINLFPFLSLFSFANIFYLRKRVRFNDDKKLMSLIFHVKMKKKIYKKLFMKQKLNYHFRTN